MNYDNMNTCVAPVLNNDCCVKSTPADRTIKDNMMEATEILSEIEAQVDRIKNWLWLSDDEKAPTIDITDLDSINDENKNIILNPQIALYILTTILKVLNYRYGRTKAIHRDNQIDTEVRYL